MFQLLQTETCLPINCKEFYTHLLKLWDAGYLVSCERGGCCLVAESWATLVTPQTVALQALLSMGFPRQEYWSRLPFPFP